MSNYELQTTASYQPYIATVPAIHLIYKMKKLISTPPSCEGRVDSGCSKLLLCRKINLVLTSFHFFFQNNHFLCKRKKRKRMNSGIKLFYVENKRYKKSDKKMGFSREGTGCCESPRIECVQLELVVSLVVLKQWCS